MFVLQAFLILQVPFLGPVLEPWILATPYSEAWGTQQVGWQQGTGVAGFRSKKTESTRVRLAESTEHPSTCSPHNICENRAKALLFRRLQGLFHLHVHGQPLPGAWLCLWAEALGQGSEPERYSSNSSAICGKIHPSTSHHMRNRTRNMQG